MRAHSSHSSPTSLGSADRTRTHIGSWKETCVHLLTVLGYISVVHRPSGSWEVRRGIYRAESESLPRALWFVGFQTPEARAIAGRVFHTTRDAFASGSSA